MASTNTNGIAHNRVQLPKLITTDIALWAWPLKARKGARDVVMITSYQPPYCYIEMRAWLKNEKGRLYVELVQPLQISIINAAPALNSVVEKPRCIPSWVDKSKLAQYIDTELQSKFPDKNIGRTMPSVIDMEMVFSRAV